MATPARARQHRDPGSGTATIVIKPELLPLMVIGVTEEAARKMVATADSSKLMVNWSPTSNSRRVGCEWGVRWDAIARVARYAV
jgi:hypothetical protein